MNRDAAFACQHFLDRFHMGDSAHELRRAAARVKLQMEAILADEG